MNLNIDELIAAVGSLAELSALFYNSLLSNGVEESTALDLTNIFMKSILNK